MFEFYATFDASSLCSYVPDVPILLPASSWSRKGLNKPALPAHVSIRAADSGGFVASRIWGEYRYSLERYVQWLASWSPQWAACMDYCCEPELAVVTRERQDKTTANILRAWAEYRSVPWAWVPTIQGLEVEDYHRHALELKDTIEDMRAYYAGNPAFRVGIGTLCRRADSSLIRSIVATVSSVLPDIPLHLWGVKLESLWTLDMRHVVSTDSAAWHGMWGTNRQRIRTQAQAAGMNTQQYLIKQVLLAYRSRVHEAVEASFAIRAEIDTAWMRDALRLAGYTLRVRERNGRRYASAVRRRGSTFEEIHLAVLHDVTPALLLEKLGTCPAGTLPNMQEWRVQDETSNLSGMW